MNRSERRQAGFTLLEVLVALVIVGLGLTAVFGQLNQTLMATGLLRDKTFATWVAVDRITELRVSAEFPDVGERSDSVEMAGVEPHVVHVVAVHNLFHGPHHHVSRRQFRARVRLHHETFPLGIAQIGAFAPKSLGQQKCGVLLRGERRGMELQELHVAHHRPGPIGHGVTVAGSHYRIGGVREDLPGSAAGKDHGPRKRHGELAPLIHRERPAC